MSPYSAFFEVGNVLTPELNSAAKPLLGSTTADVFVLHGMVGGIFSVANRGNFASGFLSGGVSSLGDLPEFDIGFVGNVAEHAALGGAASVLGGGKFSNGAMTGAFGYLFNYCSHNGCWTTNKERALVDRGDFLGYYTKACEGGDQYACFAYGVASGENPGPGVTLRKALMDNGYSLGQANSLVKTTIPVDLAKGYAYYLPQSEDQARFPAASDIARIHWDEFAKYGLPSSTFGGTPFGQNGPIVLKGLWCGETCK